MSPITSPPPGALAYHCPSDAPLEQLEQSWSTLPQHVFGNGFGDEDPQTREWTLVRAKSALPHLGWGAGSRVIAATDGQRVFTVPVSLPAPDLRPARGEAS